MLEEHVIPQMPPKLALATALQFLTVEEVANPCAIPDYAALEMGLLIRLAQ